MTTVGDDIQVQIKRNQKLVQQYIAIGPEAKFGVMMIQRDIDAAVKALAEGDIVAILRAYEALRNNKG